LYLRGHNNIFVPDPKKYSMKRLIIPAIALLAGTAALNAQSSSGFTYDVQQIPVAPFQKGDASMPMCT